MAASVNGQAEEQVVYPAIKSIVRSTWRRTLGDELKHERDEMRRLGFTQDYREGVAAFLEKREPTFLGR